MKERPIIFNSEMVKAILDNRKSQTRRVVKFPKHNCTLPFNSIENNTFRDKRKWCAHTTKEFLPIKYPYGKPGDRLWVKEDWYELYERGKVHCYAADKMEEQSLQRSYFMPAKIMPKDYSRITLEITDIRVERLQEISEDDSKAEGSRSYKERFGINPSGGSIVCTYKWDFIQIWNSLSKSGFKWEDNPWVWVILFKRVKEAL